MSAEVDTKQIDCPDHKGSKLHMATLYCWPHTLAGIWECNKIFTSGNHEHTNTGVETVTNDRMGIDGHYQTEEDVYVCNDCGVTLEGYPEVDRAEMAAEMQSDFERGK